LFFLVRQHKLDILFILETLVTDNRIRHILPKLGFDHFDFVPPVNHAARIAVLWNSGKIHASILQKSLRFVHLLVHDTTLSVSSIISGIYATAQPREKDSFWQYLAELNIVFDLPWCIIGDFNKIANPSEKQGGQVFPCHKRWRLNQFLSITKGVSVPVNRSIFTWKK